MLDFFFGIFTGGTTMYIFLRKNKVHRGTQTIEDIPNYWFSSQPIKITW